MERKMTYKTKQREILMDYFVNHPGVHVNAIDMYGYLRGQGMSVGQSTIYRHLEKLVDEGILSKYIIDGNSPACFAYVGEEHKQEETCCFHCKCEKCGKLIHLHCEELQEMQAHLLARHQFKLDPQRTVLYGRCEECRE